MIRTIGRKISPYAIVGFWILFTVALALWWVFFAYGFLSSLALEYTDSVAEFASKRRMLVYEGITLVVLLFAGGAGLAYYVLREDRRNRQIKQFFAAFSHDLKTPIASLRLQAESLDEDLADKAEAKLAKRLVRDSVRLELQLENSLMLANIEDLGTLHIEEMNLQDLAEPVRHAWPELNILVTGSARIRGDRRALSLVLKNLATNSMNHGKAKTFFIESAPSSRPNRMEIICRDDGTGFRGEFKQLGELFLRPSATSGSGIGLYLSRELMRKMGGSLTFHAETKGGFRATIELDGREA